MDRFRKYPYAFNRSYPGLNSIREQGQETKYDIPVISFIVNQPFGDLYSPEEGLKEGTIFRGLDKPLCSRGCGK